MTADQHAQTNLPYEDEAFVPLAQSSTPIWFPQGLLLRAVLRRVQKTRRMSLVKAVEKWTPRGCQQKIESKWPAALQLGLRHAQIEAGVH